VAAHVNEFLQTFPLKHKNSFDNGLKEQDAPQVNENQGKQSASTKQSKHLPVVVLHTPL
jgi:hypothetical protein